MSFLLSSVFAVGIFVSVKTTEKESVLSVQARRPSIQRKRMGSEVY